MGADRHTESSDSVSSHSVHFGPVDSSPGEIPGRLHRAAGPSASASRKTEFFSLRRGERYGAGVRSWRDGGLVADTSIRGEVRA